MASQATLNKIQEVYIGLLSRSADLEGLEYWADEIERGVITIEQVRANIVNEQPEYASGLGSLTSRATLVASLYLNLFNREPEATGLEYWVNGGGKNVNADQLVLALVNGASAVDRLVLDNRVDVSNYYTNHSDFNKAEAISILLGVTSSVATVVHAKNLIDSESILLGPESVLTAGLDSVLVSDPTSINTVRGVFDDGGDNETFNLGDVIDGNGHTKVRLTLEDTGDVDYVEMSGVDELMLVAADDSSTGQVDIDASGYGDEISKISLHGVDGMSVDIENLQADDTLEVSLQTGGYLEVSGEWADSNFYVSLSNTDDSSHSSLSLAAAEISAVAGNDSYVYASLYQSASGSDDIESAGSMTLGNINLSAGERGEVDFWLSLQADNTNTGSGIAEVGDLTIGDLTLTLAKSATDTDITISMSADADEGDATVGNLNVGNIVVNADELASFSQMNFYQYAYTDRGDATVGSRSFGDINLTQVGGYDSDNNSISFSQSASAENEGNAVIGDTTIGNITVNLGDDLQSDIYVYAWADAEEGNAVIGNTVVGDVVTHYGDGNQDHSFSIKASASAETGDAIIGNVTVGDITQSAGDDKDLWTYVWRNADSNDGNATVGDIIVGDVMQTVGDNASASFEASQSAYADSGDATVGNLTIGNMTSIGGDNSDLNAYIYQWGGVNGGNLTMGNLTVGDVDFQAQVSGSAYFSMEQTGYALQVGDTVTIGETSVGNVNLQAGASGRAGFGVYVTGDAYDGREGTSVGDVSVGNVNMSVGNDGNASFWNSISAGSVADVNYGDISINVGENAEIRYFYINVSASTGDVGDFNVGDVSINLGVDSYNQSYDYAGFDVYSAKGIGDITIGDQLITVATGADFGDNNVFEHHFYAEDDSIGAVRMGDITMIGNGDGADSDLDIYFWAEDNIESVRMGDLTMRAEGFNSDISLVVDISASDEIGAIRIGDLNATALGEDADADIDFDIWADDDIAGVTFGDVVIHAENEHAAIGGADSASATVEIYITGSEDLGNVTVGNITMHAIGGDAEANFDLLIGTDLSGTDDYLQDVGNVSIGNFSLTASGEYADIDVTIEVDTDTDVIGTVTLGNIDIMVANTQAAGEYRERDFVIDPNVDGPSYSVDIGYYLDDDRVNPYTTGTAAVSMDVDAYGDLHIGDINLSQGDMTGWGVNYTSGYWETVGFSSEDVDGDDFYDVIGYNWVVDSSFNNANMYANLDFSSWYGDLVIGDITVTGGYLTEDGDYSDNFQSLDSWLSLYADGSITIGNIDYSGYERDALIDVESYLGATYITAASADTYIIDNDGQNIITLGSGDDTIQFVNENSAKSSADIVDAVIGFNGASDKIALEFSWYEFAVNANNVGTYAQFLLDADTANQDIYAGKVGNDYFIAFDTNNENEVDFVVKLVGVSNVSESFFELDVLA